MSRRSPDGLRGPIRMSWPEPAPDLEAHPEFAALGALHACAVTAIHALFGAQGDLFDETAIRDVSLHDAAKGLLSVIEHLLVALDRYRLEADPPDWADPPLLAAAPSPRLALLRALSPEQALLIHAFLEEIAAGVWDACDPLIAELLDADRRRCDEDLHDMPF